MIASSTDHPLTRGARGVSIALSLLAGASIGILLAYATSLAANLPVPGGYTVHPLTLLLLAVVAAGAVLVGWWRPGAGLVAGVTVLLVVVWAVTSGMGWVSGSSTWIDPFSAIGFATVSGYPAMIGAALVTASAARLSTARRRER